ncbi:MAG: FecR domain-containing protein [Proteobacteria bacterium]|nr:FecR domain-containing protein [Pseudomonadota bacterium]
MIVSKHPSARGSLMLTIFILIALLTFGDAQAAVEAGKVVTIAGRAAAATQDGDIRKLDRGGPVNAGDTVVTSANSYVRMKFVDGASVILRPNSRFHIEDYRMAEAQQESRSFFNLVKGGFRAVTGLIGKQNPASYRVRTAVATIGIRGTDYSMVTCQDGSCSGNPDGDYYQVHEGRISVVTGGGESEYASGDFGYVSDPSMSPINISEAQADALTDDPLPAAACE